jgi:hypothetical protein
VVMHDPGLAAVQAIDGNVTTERPTPSGSATFDGTSGTIVFDPPVPDAQAVGGVVANDPGPLDWQIANTPAFGTQSVASVVMRDPGMAAVQAIDVNVLNQIKTDNNAASDNFVFSPSGNVPVSDFHRGADLPQFISPIFASAQDAFGATLADGHSNPVVTPDGQDVLGGVLRAQLHVNDFHVV